MFAPDVTVLVWVAEHRTSWVTRLSNLLMSASGSLPVIAAFGVLATLFVALRRRWADAVVVAAAAVIAVVLTGVLKVLIGRERPPAALALVRADGFSMPSTDGALTAAAALALFLVGTWSTRTTRRTAAAVLGTVVVLVGACLVYLGAHWPSDVVAGWAVGALTAGGCHAAHQWIRRRWAGGPAAA